MDATSPEAARWLGKLSALNVDAAKKTQPIGAAPHKPLLMLVVCDLVEEGALAFRFGTYWRIVGDRRRTKPDLRLPFFHIRSDEFWRPLEADGRPAETREHAVLLRQGTQGFGQLAHGSFNPLLHLNGFDLNKKMFEIRYLRMLRKLN